MTLLAADASISTGTYILIGVLAAVGGIIGSLAPAIMDYFRGGKDTDQRETAAAREEWWRRCQWAVGRALAPGPGWQSRAVGFAGLAELGKAILPGRGSWLSSMP